MASVKSIEFSSNGLAFKFWPASAEVASIRKSPIVILHGLFGSHQNFSSFARIFSKEGYPILCFDARNHGESFHDEAMNYALMAEDLELLLCNLEKIEYRGLDWKNVIVLGHSMGGRSSIMYSILYPSRVERLILVDVLPSVEAPDTESISRILTAMMAVEQNLQGIHDRKTASDLFRRELIRRGSESEAVLQFLLSCNLKRNMQGQFSWCLHLSGIEKNLRDLLFWPANWVESRISLPIEKNIPVFLVAGGRSPYVRELDWQLLLRYLPHTKDSPTIKTVIKEAHHWPHSEKPEQFHHLVREFLSCLSKI